MKGLSTITYPSTGTECAYFCLFIEKQIIKLRTDFGRRRAPSAPYVRYLMKKVKETAILIDKPKRKKLKTVRTPENIAV